MSQPINQSTVEEIPPDAVHVNDKTVFDDGVIVAKYIGDQSAVQRLPMELLQQISLLLMRLQVIKYLLMQLLQIN